MNVQEFYRHIGGDYENVKRRLLKDERIVKYVLKFPADPSMEMLDQAVADNDIEASFRAAHTMKGVASNLSFSILAQAASELTEQLRDRQNNPDPALYERTKNSYNEVIEGINCLEA